MDTISAVAFFVVLPLQALIILFLMSAAKLRKIQEMEDGPDLESDNEQDCRSVDYTFSPDWHVDLLRARASFLDTLKTLCADPEVMEAAQKVVDARNFADKKGN